MNAGVAVLQMNEGSVQRVLVGLFERVEIADGAALFNAAHRVDGAGLVQQRLGQRCLAGSAMTDQRDSADCLGSELRHGDPSVTICSGLVEYKRRPNALQGG